MKFPQRELFQADWTGALAVGLLVYILIAIRSPS